MPETGNWQGFTTGNTNFIGIEAENTGLAEGPKADPGPTCRWTRIAAASPRS